MECTNVVIDSILPLSQSSNNLLFLSQNLLSSALCSSKNLLFLSQNLLSSALVYVRSSKNLLPLSQNLLSSAFHSSKSASLSKSPLPSFLIGHRHVVGSSLYNSITRRTNISCSICFLHSCCKVCCRTDLKVHRAEVEVTCWGQEVFCSTVDLGCKDLVGHFVPVKWNLLCCNAKPMGLCPIE